MRKRWTFTSQPCYRCGCDEFIAKEILNGDDYPLFDEPPWYIKKPLPDYRFICTCCGNDYEVMREKIIQYSNGFISRHGEINSINCN